MRKEGWEIILSDMITDAMNKPFKWGEHDCALFMGRVVRAISGIDTVSHFEGKYDTEKAAKALLKPYKGGIIGLLDNHPDLEKIDVKMAKRGDIVFDVNSKAVGICLGRDSAFISPIGMVFLRTLGLNKAWGIKCRQ